MMPLISALALMAAQTQPLSTPLLHDSAGRPVIEAQLNGQGPFKMVLDTAAQTSFLTPHLAADLHLKPLPDSMSINAAAGKAVVSLYGIDQFETGLFKREDVALLVMPNAATTDARGLVGMETFGRGTLVIDKDAGLVSLVASDAALPGFTSLTGKVLENGLVSVPVTIDGVTIEAIVDSGACCTVANLATLRALGWAKDDKRLKDGGSLRGATADTARATLGTVDGVKLGPVTFSMVELVFSDLTDPASATAQQPSLILGSDILNRLSAYAIDFQHGDIDIRPEPD